MLRISLIRDELPHLGHFCPIDKKKKGYYAGDAKWRFDVKSFGGTRV
jgi:hypothetical protein